MKKRSYLKRDGFSLMELMVVVGLIALMSTIILMSVATAREGSRDRERIADLAELEFAVELYKLQNKAFPAPASPSDSYDDGVLIEQGEEIFTQLSPFITGTIKDPRSGGSFGYQFSSSLTCDGLEYYALAALTMEKSGSSNYADLCGDGESQYVNAYIILLEESL